MGQSGVGAWSQSGVVEGEKHGMGVEKSRESWERGVEASRARRSPGGLRRHDDAVKRRLARRKVVEEDREGLGLLAVVLDDDARAADDLAGDALLVELAEASPLAEELGVRDLRRERMSAHTRSLG